MAKSKRRKKTYSQKIVGSALVGVPRPVKNMIASRWGARLILLLAPLMVGTGIIGIDWSHGRPRLRFNFNRAAEVRQSARGKLDEVVENLPDEFGSLSSSLASLSLFESRTDRIKIATFNIQVMGESKAAKPQVMEKLAVIIRQFDIVAIQELRTKSPEPMEKLVNLVNADGAAYRYAVGPRLGRTVSKEQYVFVFDSTRIDIDPSSILTIQDPDDLLHREPMIARFQAKSETGQGFSFILINIHTDPGETKTELNALDDVFRVVQANQWGEDDVILLGDLNVDDRHLGELGELPNIAYTIHGEPTNARGTKSYDNIVYDSVATTEFTGTAGVLNMTEVFGISESETLEISDHMPVWAEFSKEESGGQRSVANLPTAQQPAIQPPQTQPVGQAPNQPEPPRRRITDIFRRQ